MQCSLLDIPITTKNDDRLIKTKDKYGNIFDPRCIINLEWILFKTGAKIVISSSWRNNLNDMQKFWKERRYPGDVIGITPRLKSRIRGEEIQQFINEFDMLLSSYCILDDNKDMMKHQKSNFVHINEDFGITYYNADHAIKILNKNDKK